MEVLSPLAGTDYPSANILNSLRELFVDVVDSPVVAIQAKGCSLLSRLYSFEDGLLLNGDSYISIDSFHPDSIQTILNYEPWLPCCRVGFYSPNLYDFYNGFVFDGEREITKYIDDNLPLSLWSLRQSMSRESRRRKSYDVRPLYYPGLHYGYCFPAHDPGIWGLQRLDIHDLWVDPVPIDLPLDTSAVLHSKNIPSQASQAYSPKGVGPTVSRKPATLPQRK